MKKCKDIEKYFPLCWKNIIDKLYPFDVIHFQKQKQKENIGTSHNPFIYSMSCYKKLIAYQDNLNHSWQERYEKKVKNKFRADSRRQRRRLAEFGELRFVVAKDRGAEKKY